MIERSGGRAHRRRRWLLAVAAAAGMYSTNIRLSSAAEREPPGETLLPGLAPGQQVRIELVGFPGPGQAPVKVIRGDTGHAEPPGLPERVEIVTFGKDRPQQVAIVRGTAKPAPVAAPAPQALIETVAFGQLKSTVTIVRGPSVGDVAVELFGPANASDLDRIAFAVDGIESRHGADPGMWRPEPDGPQGPMQVSLRAALDVGGGNRFDLQENRLLGRAYLAQLYRRYGNWADALAAYNWGPGNMDQWIAGGRRADMLPLEVARYVERALRDALLAARRF